MDQAEKQDSIAEISLTGRSLYGEAPEFRNLDLIKAYVIRLRGKAAVCESRNQLIAMLETLLSDEEPLGKKRKLERDYGIKMSVALERRIESMCNLSEMLAEKWLERGLEQGLKQGHEQGRIEERIKLIRRMISSGIGQEQIIGLGFTKEELRAAEDDE